MIEQLQQLDDWLKQNLTRWFPKNGRGWQLAGLALLTAGIVTACGGFSPNNSDSKQYTSSNVKIEQLTRTVQHEMGKTKVPEMPQRIVALGFPALEWLTAMNVFPVGAPLNEQVLQFLELTDNPQIQNIHDLGNPPPNMERILNLDPDLIVGITKYGERIYDQISQIAPTVLFDWEGTRWKALFQETGQAIGQPEAARQVLANYHARLENLRDQLDKSASELEVSVLRMYPSGQISLRQKGGFAGDILEDAGLARPPSQQGNSTEQQISKEALPKADGDILFIWSYGGDAQAAKDANQLLAQLQADPLWSQLEVVQEGKVYSVGSYWIGSGPIAANLVIDDLFRYLVEEDS